MKHKSATFFYRRSLELSDSVYIFAEKKEFIFRRKMKKGHLFFIVTLFILLVVGCSDRKEYREALERAKATVEHSPDSALSIIDSVLVYADNLSTGLSMRLHLYRMDAQNKLDSIFHSTSEAEDLVKYFNRKGTANEQMLANYLLARCYSDIGEAPQAVEQYKTATECADTTSNECNYKLLSRVYGQMSEVLHSQHMMHEELECIDRGVKYAWQGKDTLSALVLLSSKMDAYDWLQEQDSVLYYSDLAYKLFNQYGYPKYAAAFLGTSIHILAERGEIEKARTNINIYESQSGYFDKDGNIEKGREIYYYIKGMFYLAVHKPDSAIMLFKKESSLKEEYHQEAVARGLSLAYRMRNQLDSATHYAILSYELNNASSNKKAIEAVAQTLSLYNYNHHLKKAREEEKRADEASEKLHLIIYVIIIAIVFLAYYFRKTKKEKQQKMQEYETNKKSLSKIENELIELRQVGLVHEKLIEEKENEIIRLKAEISNYNPDENDGLEKVEEALIHDERYKLFDEIRNTGRAITDEQWKETNALIAERLPEFSRFLVLHNNSFSSTELKTCILIRMHVKPKVISNILGLSASAISKARINMLHNIFNKDGKPAEFDQRILTMT
jgi:hypothetical protein